MQKIATCGAYDRIYDISGSVLFESNEENDDTYRENVNERGIYMTTGSNLREIMDEDSVVAAE